MKSQHIKICEMQLNQYLQENKALNANIRKGSSQINNLSLQFEKLEKEQIKTKVKRAEKLINIRTNINEIESRKAIEGNNQTKVWSFGVINKIHTPLLNY